MSFWNRGTGDPRATPVPPVSDDAAAEMTNEELINAVAGRVVRMRLGVPAVFFLESTKPLSFVGSQVLVFLQPFVEAFLTIRNYQRFAALIEDRENIERLIQRVEALDEEMRDAEKKARDEEKRARKERRREQAKKT
ncbi:MAG: hypothetical protein KAY32_11205 [Candidatus Eisenbacteria sp.]|nr:hypothetical protein [Candidatus Eisenbacteria bacterium]